jgi:hypothetical protein
MLKKSEMKLKRKEERLRQVTDELINKVDELLPPQPWKAGIHHEIAGKLGLDPKDVSAAIGRLIQGKRVGQNKVFFSYSRCPQSDDTPIGTSLVRANRLVVRGLLHKLIPLSLPQSPQAAHSDAFALPAHPLQAPASPT